MTTWNADKRQQYKKEHPENFAGPDLSFPIEDEEDVTKAWDLAGHSADPNGTRKKVKAIAKRLGFTHSLPTTANMSQYDEEEDSLSVFSLDDSTPDGPFFRRVGKVFELGEYPDKDFSLNAEEARAAVEAFQPILNKGAHVPTIFDGKMGMLEKVELAEDGVTLNGTITVPAWLQTLHGSETPLRASLEWDRETKRIVGSTLIPNPRVADSALMGAFSAAETPKEGEVISFIDTLKVMLGIDKKPEKAEETVEMGNTATTTTTTTPVEDPRVASLEKQLAELRAKDRQREAAGFAKELFANRRVLPVQMNALTAVFEAAIGLDEGGAKVNFADAEDKQQTVSVVDAIKAVFMAAPQHNLTIEQSENLLVFGASGATAGNAEDPDGAKAAAASAAKWAKTQNPQAAAK